MRELCNSEYFGVALSVIAFWIGVKIQKKTKSPICNPLIIAIVLIVGVLEIFHISYEAYDVGGAIINMFRHRPQHAWQLRFIQNLIS